jgi:hypothetical protein
VTCGTCSVTSTGENAMPDEQRHEVPNADDATGTAFAEIPLVPTASALNRPTSRTRSLVVSALVGLSVIGLAAVYLPRPTDRVDPNAPRVVVEVSGMHCPIQCGLRVSASLEKLPFVIPGSVTANPKTGVVIFAATSAAAVDEDQIRQAIGKAGFGFRSVRTPEAPSRVPGDAGAEE